MESLDIDVIFVGQTGVGKSSLINMIMSVADTTSNTPAKVSNDAHPCTTHTTSYSVTLIHLNTHLRCQLWDTRGLDEAAGTQSFMAKLVDRIRQLANQQARELKETLRDRIKVAEPILMWCIDAAKVDVDAHWQQFQKVYVEYCDKRAMPVVVITRGPPRDGWETKCTERILGLNLGVDVPVGMVRKYRNTSCLEYRADSEALRDLIFKRIKNKNQ